MSDIVEQYYRYRKFCKIIGLHSIFSVFEKGDDIFYDTSKLDENKIKSNEVSRQLYITGGDNTLPITKDTIIFITADSIDVDNKIEISTEDSRTLYEYDTMLWVNGNIYSLSQKNVKTIFYNEDEKKLDIIYSDDDKYSIDVTDLQVSRKIAVKFPLSISEETGTGDNENEEKFDYIRLFGQDKNDSGRNFVIGMYENEEYKNDYDGLTYTTIIGKGNKASEDGQIILGDFNKSDNSKFIVCNGNSDSERKNIFTISTSGKVHASEDFVLSTETNVITHRLSDIHSVTVDDWYKET